MYAEPTRDILGCGATLRDDIIAARAIMRSTVTRSLLEPQSAVPSSDAVGTANTETYRRRHRENPRVRAASAHSSTQE